jgi:hypothetical protein
MNAKRRAMDNTLPQSAYAWFRYPEQPWIDPAGHAAFDIFVDAYVNTPQRVVPLPRTLDTPTDPRIEEPLIQLWQRGAEQVPGAAKPLPLDQLWTEFELSVRHAMPAWSAWARFQWSKLIVPAYKARTEGKWPERWELVLPYVQAALPRFASDTTHRTFLAFHDQLERDLSLLPDIDSEYRAFASGHNIANATAAIAFSFDWFQRGDSYRKQTPNSAKCFHDLRRRVALTGVDSTEPVTGELELPWGRILEACIARGLFPRDPGLLCAHLETVAATVKSDEKYRHLLQVWAAASPGAERAAAMLAAAAHVLREAELPLQFREEMKRKKLLDSLQQMVDKSPPFSLVPVPLVYSVCRLVLDTSTAKWAEYDARQAQWPETVWKVFVVPGLEHVA